MTIAIDSFGITDIGKARQKNDDNFLIVEIRKEINVKHSSLARETLGDRFGSRGGHLFVVADGVGGRPEGDRASGDTVKAVLKYVSGVVGCFETVTAAKEHEFFEKLEEAVQQVHEALIDSPGFNEKNSATTLTMVLLMWPRAYFVHVGDSRAYVQRAGRLQQLTRDQTLGDYMQEIGAWTAEQAARSIPGATLTSAIGGTNLEPAVGLVDLEPGDGMVLCTDGLVRHVPDTRIADLMSSDASSQSIAKALVADALEGGGRDNISVIVFKALAA